MKMVKSLLLGSAAGLAAVAGAQAADLPVKAKAVEYVKVCSLYGAGFYYIPGTDTCIKIGGFLRTEWNHNAAGSFNTNLEGPNALYNRSSDTLVNRSRGIMTFDVRSQTEYGTLRSYLRAGWQWTTNTDTVGGSASTVYLDRAFIQFAGFTFGKTQSFFDTPDIADMTYQTEAARQNTGGQGTPVIAYTAMLGNGVTATISMEDYTEKRANIVDLNAGTPFTVATDNVADNHGASVPDIVGNLRVDQAWGSAQISGAGHLNRAQYFGTPTGLAGQQGHPDDKWGWAVGAGILLKMPWNANDTFAINGVYAKGATKYAIQSRGDFASASNNANLVQDNGIALGWADDAYFSTGTGTLELPEVWSVSAGFQHYWTPSLRSSIWGAFADFKANSSAVNALICAPATRGAAAGAILGSFGPGCTDYSFWQVGSRTIWNPVTNLDIGLEVMYSKVNTAFEGGQISAAGAVDPSLRIKDTDVWSGIVRIQRNFWP